MNIIEDANVLYSIDKESSNKLKVNNDFEFDYNRHYQDIFSQIQPMVEEIDGLSLEDRILVADNSTVLLSFLTALNNMSEKEYIKFAETIYYDFLMLIGKFYLEDLYLIVRKIKQNIQ